MVAFVPYEGPETFAPPGTVQGPVAWLLCVGVLGFGVAAAIVVAWLRARALRATQEREHELLRTRAARPPSEGPGRVVRGRVELDGGEEVAIEIDVLQIVRNHTSKNARWHTWTEVSREARVVRPFYLVTDAGEAVYVEPGEGAQVIDALETSYPIDKPGLRLRRADVRAGEVFYAYGDLHAGRHPRAASAYRDGAGWVMRRPRATRMLLATDGVQERYVGRTRFLRRWAAAVAISWCIFHGFCTTRFLPAAIFGERTTAEVVRAKHGVVPSRNGSHPVYALTAVTTDGFSLEQSVDAAVYTRVTRLQAGGEPVTIPITRTGRWEEASYLGEQPYVHVVPLALGLMAGLFALVLLWRGYERTFAWYDRSKLVERGGDRHWVETRPARPIGPGAS